MTYTEAEIQGLLESYFDTGSATCPRCGRGIQVRDRGNLGDSRASLEFLCAICPQVGLYDPPETFTRQQWTEEERSHLSARACSGEELRCPIDHALIYPRRQRINLGGPVQITVNCRRCGNIFHTRLEPAYQGAN